MSIPQVEGLTMLEGPRRSRMAGSKFALPPSFDSRKYSAKWVEAGPQVLEAQQSTVLDFANCEAQGWTVFKVLETKKHGVVPIEDSADAEKEEGDEPKETKPKQQKPKLVPCTRASGKNIFVLMFRPKALQQAVNKLYAGQSRQIVNREVLGETNAANTSGDAGILTNADLRRHSRDLGDDAPDGYLAAVQSARPAEATELHIN